MAISLGSLTGLSCPCIGKKMIGDDLEKGLAQMKALAEQKS
jgi:hypothetical protein